LVGAELGTDNGSSLERDCSTASARRPDSI